MKHLFGAALLMFTLKVGAEVTKPLDLARGPISSGGGMGVVCYDSNGENIESVELLDLWEAKKLYDRVIPESSLTVQGLVTEHLNNLKHSLDSQGFYVYEENQRIHGAEAIFKILQNEVSRFLYNGKLPSVKRLRGVELTLTDDAFEIIRPIDCKLKQLVRYIDTARGGEIIINQDLLDKMDSVNLAALYLHEVLYALLRSYNEQSSIRTRRTIGLSMSGHRFEPWSDFLPEEYIECVGFDTAESKVYIYEPAGDFDSLPTTTIAVSSVSGRKMLGNTAPESWWLNLTPEEVLSDIEKNSWGVLGPVIGNDFSYRFMTKGRDPVDGNKWRAQLSLMSSPDHKSDPVHTDLICTKNTN